jgi:hypothetical protein
MPLHPFGLRSNHIADGGPGDLTRVPRSAGCRPERADMTRTRVHSQYSTGVSRHNIDQARIAAGKDLDDLQPSDLALVEPNS